jgi:hypothetical protein
MRSTAGYVTSTQQAGAQAAEAAHDSEVFDATDYLQEHSDSTVTLLHELQQGMKGPLQGKEPE